MRVGPIQTTGFIVHTKRVRQREALTHELGSIRAVQKRAHNLGRPRYDTIKEKARIGITPQTVCLLFDQVTARTYVVHLDHRYFAHVRVVEISRDPIVGHTLNVGGIVRYENADGRRRRCGRLKVVFSFELRNYEKFNSL